jgi:diguanylate cyclase (GGDEF)-like protein/PAS domain S-box-containing protein
VTRFFLRWRHWLLLVFCLGSLGVYLASNNQRERGRIEAREVERLTLQSKVMEDTLTRQFTAISRSLESISGEMLYWDRRTNGRSEALQHIRSMEAAMPSVRTFLALDAKGSVSLSSREELIGRNLYQREYFQLPLQSLNPKTLHVSAPFKSALDVYVMALSRAMTDAKGKFAGVVVATIDPVELRNLLSSVRYADDMRSTLVHGDGTVFAVEPPTSGVLGTDLSNASSFFSRHLKSHIPVSYFKGKAFAAGDERLVVLRTIQPPDLSMDKPVVFAVSRQLDSLFVQWRSDVQSQFLAYLSLVLLSSLGLTFYHRQRVQLRVNNQRLKLATEASGVGIWEYDLATRRYHWDNAMFSLFGLTPQSVNAMNNDWRGLLLPGELERMKEATRTTIQHDLAFDLTFQVRRTDGEVRFMRNRAALHRDAQGKPSRLIGATEDVTERDLQEAYLRVAATVFDCQEAIIVTDAKQVILRVNPAFSELFGYTSVDAVGATPRILQSGRHGQAFYAAIWDGINRNGAWQGEIWNRRKNAEVFPLWLNVSAVHNHQGVVTHFVATYTDITLRKAAEDEIKQLAFYDPLTRLPNRRLLNDRLHQAINQAKRDQRRLALVFIDLDKFKPVNDAFGHQAGDELLQAVALRLQACVRESDTVARQGGDEFVLLLPSIDSAQDAMAVAEKVHRALIQPFTLPKGQQVSISLSAGIAIYPEHGSDAIELTKHADAAMYQAKIAGRDRVVFYASASEGLTVRNP